MSVTRSCFAGVTILALPFLWFGLVGGDDFLIRFFPDDAFYYIKTAAVFVDKGLISFDGVNWTNGFHPLFFLVSVLVDLVFPETYLLNAFFLLNVLLVG